MLLAMSYFNVLKLSKVINKQIKNVSPYSVWMRENTNQNNSEYGHFSRSEVFGTIINMEALTWLQLIYLMRLFLMAFFNYTLTLHCVKSVCVWSFCGPYSARMRGNADQKNSEYEHFPLNVTLCIFRTNENGCRVLLSFSRGIHCNSRQVTLYVKETRKIKFHFISEFKFFDIKCEYR